MKEAENSKNRWLQVKSKILGEWESLTDDELEGTKGNISNITQLVMSKYQDDKSNIVQKLVELVHSVDNEDDLPREQNGIVVDSRDPGSKEWDAREDVNLRS